MATRRPLVLVGGELKELPAGDTMLSALLGATTVGDGLLKLPNPGALSFLRINADNTISALAAADFRSAIGAGTSSFSGVYSALSGIPASFPPAAHSHAYSALTGIPATFTPAAHSHGWDGITDKPTAFAPSAHNQAWSTITTTPTTLSGYGITDAQGLDADLTALAGLSANGLIARTGSGTAAARTITGTANQVIVTNGDGAAGNPTLSLPQSIATTSTPLFAEVGVNGAAASFRLLQFYTGGVRRINVGTDGAGESGANAGSNFQITRFDDAGNSLGAALFIQRSTGNVGIGTSSPAAQLHIRSGSNNIAEAIRLDNPTSISDNGSKIVWRNADISNDAAFFGARRIGASTGIALTFGTAAAWSTAAATEKMRIAGNGNVGINNTNPLRKLDVVGDTGGNGIRVTGTTGTTGAFTAEGTSVNIQADSAAATRVLVDAGSSNASGFVVLNGGSSGYVQLGTGGTARMQVFASGVVKLNNYGAGTLVTDSSGNITASSDRRLKNVSGKFTRGLAAIMEIQPKVFTWKPESGMNTDDVNVGFIAQDVQGVIPEAVGSMKTSDVEEDDGTGKKVKKSKRESSEFLTLSDRPIIAALVNAVQELSAQIETLKKAKLSQ